MSCTYVRYRYDEKCIFPRKNSLVVLSISVFFLSSLHAHFILKSIGRHNLWTFSRSPFAPSPRDSRRYHRFPIREWVGYITTVFRPKISTKFGPMVVYGQSFSRRWQKTSLDHSRTRYIAQTTRTYTAHFPRLCARWLVNLGCAQITDILS